MSKRLANKALMKPRVELQRVLLPGDKVICTLSATASKEEVIDTVCRVLDVSTTLSPMMLLVPVVKEPLIFTLYINPFSFPVDAITCCPDRCDACHGRFCTPFEAGRHGYGAEICDFCEPTQFCERCSHTWTEAPIEWEGGRIKKGDRICPLCVMPAMMDLDTNPSVLMDEDNPSMFTPHFKLLAWAYTWCT